VKKAQNTNLHKLVLINKAPLSKSLSMPDMENRIKKRERLLAYVINILYLINDIHNENLIKIYACAFSVYELTCDLNPRRVSMNVK